MYATTTIFQQDVSTDVEIMLTQRLQFGLKKLDIAFKVYSELRENSSEPFDKEEFECNLRNNGIDRYFHRMIYHYCESRFTTPIVTIDDMDSYNRMISEIINPDDIKALIRRLKCQKDRLPLSSLKLSNVEYEIHGEFMNMCLNDLKIILSRVDPTCNPDTDDACVPLNDRPPIVRVYKTREEYLRAEEEGD
jgi:hypothetical protein